MNLRTDDFSYSLPPELIAQQPAPERDRSRLMVLDRSAQSIMHRAFRDLPALLRRGDLLVLNRSKVIPARLRARKETGGEIELLLLRREDDASWRALARPSRRLRPGTALTFPGSELHACLLDRLEDGEWRLRFGGVENVNEALHAVGTMPLPPYITADSAPENRYQTVYADREGSIAAPTAGLHFSRPLLQEIEASGVGIEYVTLHVGAGTFRPVATERVADHRMHAEWGELPESVAVAIQATRRSGGRVVAVGTTTTRLLESAAQDGDLRPWRGETDCFLYPGCHFRVVDALVTNFHLPRSTLLMLVSAFAGRDFVLRAYAEAIAARYRFYSFGDAMLIV